MPGTIFIEVDRWIISMLEEAIGKYNEQSEHSILSYDYMIGVLLEEYLER